jgi:hypothetical protein
MRIFYPTIPGMAMVFLLTLMSASDSLGNLIAVVAYLSGSATVGLPGNAKKIAVSSLDWLSDGMTIEVGPHSQAVLILLNGHRYELNEGAKATLTANAEPKITGHARELPALPPVPRPAPVAVESAPTSGAVRIRGATEMSGLYPRAGTVALPDKVTLHYKAVDEATSYRVTIEDERGNSLWQFTTESTDVPVPRGIVHPGTRYYWRVTAIKAGSAMAAGMAEFTTLSAENIRQREEFASALRSKSGNSAMPGLLAEVDLHFGLIAEACDEFGAALTERPQDPVLRHALDAARALLSSEPK